MLGSYSSNPCSTSSQLAKNTTTQRSIHLLVEKLNEILRIMTAQQIDAQLANKIVKQVTEISFDFGQKKKSIKKVF